MVATRLSLVVIQLIYRGLTMMSWNEKCQLEDSIDEAYFQSPEWAELMAMVEYSLEYPTIEISPSHTIHLVSEDEWKRAARMPNFWDTRP